MKKVDIVRAWKDPAYRASLSDEERAQIPENPAGMVELTDEELEGVAGADSYGTTSCCQYGGSYGQTSCCKIELEQV